MKWLLFAFQKTQQTIRKTDQSIGRKKYVVLIWSKKWFCKETRSRANDYFTEFLFAAICEFQFSVLTSAQCKCCSRTLFEDGKWLQKRYKGMVVIHMKRRLTFRSNLCTLTSVCTFSILFFLHLLKYRQGESVCQSRDSLGSNNFLYSHDPNVWFWGDIVRRC